VAPGHALLSTLGSSFYKLEVSKPAPQMVLSNR